MYATIHLKANNGQYVCAEGGGGAGVVANRPIPREWETFHLIDGTADQVSSGDKVVLQAFDGLYVTAEGGGGGAVNANRSVASIWETFTLLHADGSPGQIQPGQGIALQSYNGLYVCAEGGGGREVVANRNQVGPWETFGIEIIETNLLAIDLDSNLGAGHFMSTHGVLATSGRIDARTRTYTVTDLGGFTGAVQFLFGDGAGTTIGASGVHTFGVDGRWLGRSDRTDYWSENLDPALAARITQIGVQQFWQPRYDFFFNLVARAVATAQPLVELIKAIQGNGGSAK
jgi:hypothetical protein